MTVDGGPSGQGSGKGKDKGKRKRWGEPKFSTYAGLNETLERIYLDTRDCLPYRRPARREPSERERASGKHCLFHDLDGHDTNECRHLKDMVEEHVRNGQLQRYVEDRNAAVEPERPPPTSTGDRTGPRYGDRLVIS